MTAPRSTTPPVLSVIVPVYNVADHVEACLKSVQAQSFRNFECLVIDDGSTDGSGERALKAVGSDARFTFHKQSNAGLSAARNAGMALARGEFVAFVDGDDRVMPDYLARLHATLEVEGGDWCACAFASVSPKGLGLSHPARHDVTQLTPADVPRRFPLDDWRDVIAHFPSAWNKLYRRSLLDGISFDAGVWFEDHPFFMRVAARTDHILWLPQALYLQTRGRDGQITGADDDRVMQQFPVLDRVAQIVSGGKKTGDQEALAQLACRLVHERSVALRNADRRKRFFSTAQAWLSGREIVWQPPSNAGLATGLELQGDLPLTVAVVQDDHDTAALERTLESLHVPGMPGHEVVIVGKSKTDDFRYRCVPSLREAVHCARGRIIAVLGAGDQPAPTGMESAVAAMLRDEAVMALTAVTKVDVPRDPGLGDLAPWPEETPFSGPLALNDARATGLGPSMTGRFFDRAFLKRHGDAIASGTAALAGRALNEGAPVTYLDWAAMHVSQSAEPEPNTAPEATKRPAKFGVLHRAARKLGLGPTSVAAVTPKQGLPAQTRPDNQPREARLAFPCNGRGALRLRTTFDEHPYSNLDLEGSGTHPVPFHVSVRFREGLIVVNDRGTDGRWRAERPLPYTMPKDGIELSILIEHPRLRLFVGEEEIARYGACSLLNPLGLSGLDRIESLRLEGGFRLVQAQCATPGPLTLDARLQLIAALPEDLADSELTVETGTDLTLPASEQTIVGAPRALIATLPGRIWEKVPDGGSIALNVPGLGRSPLLLDRKAMSKALSVVLQRNPPAWDSGPALTALDHVRDPEIFANLPRNAKRVARRLAAFYRLDATLPRPETPLVQRPDIDRDGLFMAMARFADSRHHDPDIDPLKLLDMLPLPSAKAHRDALLVFSEFFCCSNQDTDGFVARGRGHSFEPAGDAWSLSAQLPFLYRNVGPEAALAAIRALAKPGNGWFLTPPVADLMRLCLRPDPSRSSSTHRALLRACLSFIRQRVPDYWSRLACVELTSATAEWLLRLDDLPGDLTPRVEAISLMAYGLSREFWKYIGSSPLPPKAAVAREAFTRLQAARSNGDVRGIDHALDDLGKLGCIDVARARLDLLGVSTLPDASAPDLATLARPHAFSTHRRSRYESLETAALRLAAFPGKPRPTPPVMAAATRSIVTLSENFARFPHQARASALSPLAKNALIDPSHVQQEALWQGVQLLADDASGYLGPAVALSVIAARPDKTDYLQQHISAYLAALPAPLRADFKTYCAPRMAARRLSDAMRSDLVPGLDPTDPCGPRMEHSPLYDVIVVVFSCMPHLETRIPALRKAWLYQLDELGIPWIVVTGNGDGTRSGNVVRLDAPDDYEGLPAKTLAAIDWVRENTDASHLMKVDDDCFLNAPLFFSKLIWRRHHCLGRKLVRVPGSLDRAWHQAKSTSERGRGEYDRSPEPSTYPDGGSGYVLSRDAMSAIQEISQSPEGRRLLDSSFMEDKMVGDLLALSDFRVSDEDYIVTIRRRPAPGMRAVSAWSAGFLPSPDAPVVLAHLDDEGDQDMARSNLARPGLRPPRIWPTVAPPRLGYATNGLELVSPVSRLNAARKAPIAVVATVRNELRMLPIFLDHYRSLGVEIFLIADNLSDDGTLERLVEEPDVAAFSVDTPYSMSNYGVSWQQAMLAAFRTDRWSLIADADELLVWQHPMRQTLPELLQEPDFRSAEAARVFMLDMYPLGPLASATFESGDPFCEAGYADRVPFLTASPMTGPFSDQRSWSSALRHRLLPGSPPNLFTAQKIALLKYHPFMRLSAGLHFVADAVLSRRELIFGHFKYNAAFLKKAEAEAARGQHWGGGEEYRRYMSMAAEGRDRIYDPALSVQWHHAPFVASRLSSDS